MAAQPSPEAYALEAVPTSRAFAVGGSDLIKKTRLAPSRHAAVSLVPLAVPIVSDGLHGEIPDLNPFVANYDP
jgi:hypothetical protein